jgi:hypothetical protein
MKKLITIAIIFISFSVTAQKKEAIHFGVGEAPQNVITLKNDTLYVPAGSAKFIKVGDKVYKIVTTLGEVTPEPLTSTDFIWNRNYTIPLTTPLRLNTENN